VDAGHEIRMSRGRLFSLIDAFEQDLRGQIETSLLDHLPENEVFSEQELAGAKWRRAQDDTEDTSIVHYLDLKPTYDALARGKSALPFDLRDIITSNSAAVAALVPIRNRVMHGRPLNMDDPQMATTLLAGFPRKYWSQTCDVLDRLGLDATWEPFFEKRPIPFERTLHNLPEVDYDETTFIGRKDEAKRLLNDLRSRRYPVLTLTGEGGIGKTALALDVAYRLIDGDENPYELVLWVSLKTEMLTAYGVEDLKDAVRGIDGTVTALGRGISQDFSGSLGDLAEALEGVECLIIIDNLESARGDEVVQMVDTLPQTVNYLFTSRVGLGQLERRIPLPPLSDVEAKLLFRKFAHSRRQRNLSGLSEDALTNVVGQLRMSPLAIRWYVLSSEAGRIPLDVLRNQNELLSFCVQNVYAGLSGKSQSILSVLRALDRGIGFDEFAILTEFKSDDLRASTQELTRGALVVVEAESAGGLAGRLALTATARAFIPRPDHNGSFIAEVLKRERDFKASVETGISDLNWIDQRMIVPRDEADHPAMFLLRSAIKLANTRQFVKAREKVEHARSFNPEFSEVHRVSGFIQEAEGHYETAVSDYQAALMYASGDNAVATTSFALADLLSTRLHTAQTALPHAKKAYKLKRCGDTAFLLGKIFVWVGEYDEGQVCLEEAQDALRGRRRLMAATTLADSWRRKAEAQTAQYRFDEAVQSAAAGFHTATALYADNEGDARLLGVLSECSIAALRAWKRCDRQPTHSDTSLFRRISKGVMSWGRTVEPRKLYYLKDALVQAIDRLSGEREAFVELERARLSLTAD
jgi:LuxR family glucitol operon transcriptional activator